MHTEDPPIYNIKDVTDFWQCIETTGYAVEGEDANYTLERVKWLGKCLDAFLRAHPEIKRAPDAPLEHFAMHAASRLAYAFVFNDVCAQRATLLMDEQVLRRLDERHQFDDDGEPF
jgi:hypothetical protein